MKCKVGKNLAGRGVIGEEEPVDENQSSHRIGQSSMRLAVLTE
jgi:hypothetical protein